MKPGFSDDVQAYAAGWAEGMMSGCGGGGKLFYFGV